MSERELPISSNDGPTVTNEHSFTQLLRNRFSKEKATRAGRVVTTAVGAAVAATAIEGIFLPWPIRGEKIIYEQTQMLGLEQGLEPTAPSYTGWRAQYPLSGTKYYKGTGEYYVLPQDKGEDLSITIEGKKVDTGIEFDSYTLLSGLETLKVIVRLGGDSSSTKEAWLLPPYSVNALALTNQETDQSVYIQVANAEEENLEAEVVIVERITRFQENSANDQPPDPKK